MKLPKASMKQLLQEEMTFDQLFRVSDPDRVTRSLTVRGPPLDVDAYEDALYYGFNFKSYPSTTGLRHRGFIKFKKPRNLKTPLQNVKCEVDCSCPDYRYRWAWTNKQRRAGRVGNGTLNQSLNRAPRKTNPTGRPGMCKHLLAARQYIYNQLGHWPRGEEDQAIMLQRLVRRATTRWADFPGEMAKAREREARYAAGVRARNRGEPLPEPPELPPEEPELPPPPPEEGPAGFFAMMQPERVAGAGAPPAHAPPAPEAAPETPPRRPRRRTRRTESVDTLNGLDRMNLIEAQKTIEEMEAEQSAAPATTAETPDSEAQTALGLLREISASLKELVGALAAEPEPEPELEPEEPESQEPIMVPEPAEEEEFGEPGEEGQPAIEEPEMRRRRPAPAMR
jgi:hypothetical protein